MWFGEPHPFPERGSPTILRASGQKCYEGLSFRRCFFSEKLNLPNFTYKNMFIVRTLKITYSNMQWPFLWCSTSQFRTFATSIMLTIQFRGLLPSRVMIFVQNSAKIFQLLVDSTTSMCVTQSRGGGIRTKRIFHLIQQKLIWGTNRIRYTPASVYNGVLVSAI